MLSRSKDKGSRESNRPPRPLPRAIPNKKPSLLRCFVNYCKEVKGEMQRVAWLTRPELVNASLIVVAPSCSSASASPSSTTSSFLMPSQLWGEHMARRWYVIHTYSGYENKVKTNIEHLIETQGSREQHFRDSHSYRGVTELKKAAVASPPSARSFPATF